MFNYFFYVLRTSLRYASSRKQFRFNKKLYDKYNKVNTGNLGSGILNFKSTYLQELANFD